MYYTYISKEFHNISYGCKTIFTVVIIEKKPLGDLSTLVTYCCEIVFN